MPSSTQSKHYASARESPEIAQGWRGARVAAWARRAFCSLVWFELARASPDHRRELVRVDSISKREFRGDVRAVSSDGPRQLRASGRAEAVEDDLDKARPA